MKKETGKNNVKKVWMIAALVAVVAIVGVVLAFVLSGQQGAEQTDNIAQLYWNVDRASYIEEETGLSLREAAEDGFYYILFSYRGEQISLPIVDKQLVNYIDRFDLVALTLDADGIVIDAAEPETVATAIASGCYVREIEEDKLIVNSSKAMNGMDIEVMIGEDTGIYDVSSGAEIVGQKSDPELFAQIAAYGDEEGNVSHIYIIERPTDAGIYWRVERMFDAEKGITSRIPDENGVYTAQFAHDGALVDLKTRDIAIMNSIDSPALLSAQFAFIFDEEGYIVELVDVAIALRGVYYATDYHITAIEGDTYTVTKMYGNNQGDVKSFTLNKDCQIIQCCQFGCYEKNCGEYTDHLNMYDRVNVFTNLDGEAVMIFVTRRMVGGDAKIYFNIERKYGGDAKGTTRTKVNGYYTYEMLLDGKVTTVRVKDKEIADEIDRPYNRCVGLELDGNVVTKLHNPSCVIGGANYANETPVTALMGPVVTITSTSTGISRNFVMSADCKVYNAITGEYGKEIGGEIQLQPGDLITAYTDYKDELGIIFVNTRPISGAKIYYNLERKYNSEKQETTRVADEEGYYNFLMACEGKQVTVKTNSKGMTSFIDSQSAPLAGLKVNKNGIITNAYVVSAVLKNESKVCNYHYVKDLNTKARTFSTYYIIDGVRTDPPAVQKIAKNCKIYNVSTTFEKFRGEVSTLKNGDQIQGIKDITTGEVTKIFIMRRDPTYGFESYDAHCDHCNKKVTWKPYGGTIAAGDGHYYACGNFMVSQGVIGKKDDDKVYDVVVDLKGHSITSSGRAFLVYDKLTIMDTVGGGKVAGTTPFGETATIGSTIMMPEGATFNLMSGELTLSERSTVYGSLGGVLYVGPGCVVNMTGGSIKNGITAGNGGNVYVGGTFNMSGGTISGGTASTADNLYISNKGAFNMSGGTIDGGICMYSGADVVLSGKPVITGTGLELPPSKKISVEGLTDGASIVINGDGVFTNELSDPSRYLPYFKVAAEGDSIVIEGKTLKYIKLPKDYNGVDNSNLSFASGTTNAFCPVCEKTVSWTALTSEKALTASAGGHYYLASDLTFTSADPATSFFTASGSGTVCLHLNGKNLTCTNNRAIQASASTLNIMGNGIVSGGYTCGSYVLAATVGINTNSLTGQVNLIGGTYVSGTSNTPVVAISTNGGRINMYAGATIRGTAGSSAIHVDKASLVNASFKMYGGTVEGGIVYMTGANNDKGNTASMLLSGGKITSGVQINTNCDVTVEGNPVINDMSIKKGVTINVGKLTSGAKITVLADGVFTNTLDNANAVKQYFAPGKETDKIYVVDNALFYEKVKKDLNTVNNEDLAFSSGTNAVCPVCGGKEVTWVALSGTSAIKLLSGGHYYLAEDITYTGEEVFITAPGLGQTACVHLNGHSITATAHRVFEGNASTLNIMGNGTVSGSYNENRLFGATMNMAASNADGEINLIGGVYTKDVSCDVSPAILVRNGGDINMYTGAQVVGVNDGDKVASIQVYNRSFNLYGGKVSGGDGPQISSSNWSSTASGILKFSGGEVLGAVSINGAKTKSGGFILTGGAIKGSVILNRYVDAVISGGTVSGVITVPATCTNEINSLTLSGTPVFTGTGLQLPSGFKVILGELSSGAQIHLDANGVFTEENENASQYISAFIPPDGYEILAQGNALYCVKEAGEEQESGFVLDPDGDGYAQCPTCQQNVQWTGVTTGIGANCVDGGHYYLETDINYAGQFLTNVQKTVCLHLNNKDLSYGSRIFSSGTLNIMGNGTVTGKGTVSTAETLTGTITVNSGTVNLYGGTYKSTAQGLPVLKMILSRKSTVNIYDGVVIEACQETDSIVIEKGTLSVFGGTVKGGVKGTDAAVNVSGGTVCDGIISIGNVSAFSMTGGSVSSGVQIAAGAGVSLSGAPVIAGDGLVLNSGTMITLGQLDNATSVMISGNGPFADAGANAGTYASYFKPVNALDQIVADGTVLTYERNKKRLNEVNNSALTFENGNYAQCPVCEEKVAWTALTGDAALTLPAGGHYYLADDVTYAGAETPYITAPGSAKTACVHLNGHNITATAHRVFEGNASTLNVMGNGTVSGSYNDNRLFGATVNMAANNTDGEINLIGGTYTKPVSCDVSPAVMVRNGGDINMYAGAEIVGVADGTGVANVQVFNRSFNLYGGKVSGGDGPQIMTNNWSSTATGAVKIGGGEVIGAISINGAASKKSSFILEGGTVKGTVNLNRFVDAVISGGDVVGGITVGSSCTNENSLVTVSGAPVIAGTGLTMPAGFKLTLGQLKPEASILLSVTGEFTFSNDNAADYVSCFVAPDGYKIKENENVLTCVAQ